ncbi:MAG: FtsX-like permease family protein [Bacteroidales bacterium]|nr:FtsX-like permease family protein [Bacteroidales bacterium]
MLYRPEGAQDDEGRIIEIQTFCVDHDFVKTFGIELAAGRDFSKNFATDATEALIVNETAARQLGWESVIGKKLESGMPNNTIIGVVKDFHFRSLHHKIEPVVLYDSGEWLEFISVRIRPDRISDTLGFLKHTWHEFAPNRPFEYFFLDDSFDKLYKAEDKLGNIFGSFTFLAIFIACLGLFGLASFATEKRTKEIGIRKVLGASISNIVIMLIKEFIVLIIIASVIAYPIAHYVINKWLQNFAYRINVGLATFLVSVVIALIITLITVGSQAVRAARANPVDSLRYE